MIVNSKLVIPGTSPDEPKKDSPVGVRRVNNLPIVIFGAIMLVFYAADDDRGDESRQ